MGEIWSNVIRIVYLCSYQVRELLHTMLKTWSVQRILEKVEKAVQALWWWNLNMMQSENLQNGGWRFLFGCTNCCFYSLVFSFCFVIIWLPILASPFSFFQMTSSPAVVEFRHHAADYIAKLIKVSTIIAFKPL